MFSNGYHVIAARSMIIEVFIQGRYAIMRRDCVGVQIGDSATRILRGKKPARKLDERKSAEVDCNAESEAERKTARICDSKIRTRVATRHPTEQNAARQEPASRGNRRDPIIRSADDNNCKGGKWLDDDCRR